MQKLFKLQANSQAQLEEAATNVRIDRAHVDRIENDYEKSLLRAPFSGIVGLNELRPGQYITPAHRLLTLVNVERMQVRFAVPEHQCSHLKPGEPLSLSIPSVKKNIPGKILALDNHLDPVTHTIDVLGEAENPDHALLPGMICDVHLHANPAQKFPTIPLQALLFHQDHAYVMRVRNDRAEKVEISIGNTNEQDVAVRAGLTPETR